MENTKETESNSNQEICKLIAEYDKKFMELKKWF